MVNVIKNSCRVCLNTQIVENEIWKSITDIDDCHNNLTICDKMQLLSGVTLDTSSGLAQLICQHCFTNLEIAYDFRIACRNNESIIANFLAQNKAHDYLGEEIFDSSYETNLNLNQRNFKNILHEHDDKQKILNHQLLSKDIKEVNSFDQVFPEIKIEINAISSEEMDLESGKDENYYPYDICNSDNDNSEDSDSNSYTNKTIKQSIKHAEHKSKLVSKNGKNKKGKISVRKYSKPSVEEKMFVCELCGNVYKKRALLTDHMRWHSGSKDFKCEICGKAFLLNTYLARHVRTHTGIRNYKCDFCSRTFYTNGLKRAHEKVHTGERCYKCDLCNRTFSYSQSLQRHMLVHSGVKPHKCVDCGKEFRQESHLKQHMATNIHQAKHNQHQKFKAKDIFRYSTTYE